ncbi:hypothetical protein GIB67_020137 [Kingdonia uniflora]|uniref:DDE Tnp4 domain-containing protein n=1 Tax=Kingdonia uniflora TaxID=39325 RepID=A0A7J7NJ31_9MAGN|nr:hypothetical protein GIB67_020137 [Kingdonia uniflora]
MTLISQQLHDHLDKALKQLFSSEYDDAEEGTAHDSNVLTQTVRDPANKFPLSPPTQDMFHSCDAAYMHTKYFMCPFKGVRYWLYDFRRGGQPTTKEEYFNCCHAKLRNVIERAFGVPKARFPILKMNPKVKQFKTEPLLDEDLFAAVFRDRVATGKYATGPARDDLDDFIQTTVDVKSDTEIGEEDSYFTTRHVESSEGWPHADSYFSHSDEFTPMESVHYTP